MLREEANQKLATHRSIEADVTLANATPRICGHAENADLWETLASAGSNLAFLGTKLILQVALMIAYVLVGNVDYAFTQNSQSKETNAGVEPLVWHKIAPGLWRSQYSLTSPALALISTVELLRCSLRVNELRPVVKKIDGHNATFTISSALLEQRALVGINANFYDPNGHPLGLVVANRKTINPIQNGGDLLTGIFAIYSSGPPKILHRNEMSFENLVSAVQAGPRLVVAGAASELSSTQNFTRRSGVAINRKGEVILFATTSRIPGASLEQIQAMLLDPRLEIEDALNLDGGGSSQLILSHRDNAPQLEIFGGDPVPVGLLLFPKKVHK